MFIMLPVYQLYFLTYYPCFCKFEGSERVACCRVVLYPKSEMLLIFHPTTRIDFIHTHFFPANKLTTLE